MRVNGPYIHTSGQLAGRKYVNILDDSGKRTTMLYSRWLMERKLGRKLSFDETVDHKDEDKTNDLIDNLQILTRSENAKKTAKLNRSISWVEFICPVCNAITRKQERFVKSNKKKGKAGPYCSRKCAGKAHN